MCVCVRAVCVCVGVRAGGRVRTRACVCAQNVKDLASLPFHIAFQSLRLLKHRVMLI